MRCLLSLHCVGTVRLRAKRLQEVAFVFSSFHQISVSRRENAFCAVSFVFCFQSASLWIYKQVGSCNTAEVRDWFLFYAFLSVSGPWAARNSSIDTGSLEVGRRVTQEVPPGVFWRSLMHLSQPQFLKFNISLGKDALFGVYIRKGLPPSHAQVRTPFLFTERPLCEVLSGKKKSVFHPNNESISHCKYILEVTRC